MYREHVCILCSDNMRLLSQKWEVAPKAFKFQIIHLAKASGNTATTQKFNVNDFSIGLCRKEEADWEKVPSQNSQR